MLSWLRGSKRPVGIAGLLVFAVMAAGAVFLSDQPGHAQKNWLLNIGLNPGHMVPDAFIWAAEDIGDKTDEEIQFDVYTGAALGIKGSQLLRAVANREVEASSVWGAHIAGEMKITEVMELPFLVPCNIPLRRKISRQLWPSWEREFAERGVVMLSMSQVECRNMYTTQPIRSLDDLSGLKIRSQGPVETTFTNAIGATAVTVEWTDLYSGLQQGVVDGYWVTNSATVNYKQYENVDYAWEVQYGGATNYWLMHKGAFDSLTPQQKSILRQAGRVASNMIWDRVNTDDAYYKQVLVEDHGMTFTQPSSDALAYMQEQSRPIWNDWVEDAGPKGEKMVNTVRNMVSQWRKRTGQSGM